MVYGVDRVWTDVVCIYTVDFELSYAVYRHFCTKRLALNWKYPAIMGILLFMLMTGAAAFLIRLYVPVGSEVLGLQLGFFPLYIGMYLLGIVAHRNHWLDKICVKNALPWFLIAILCGIPSLLIVMSSFQNRWIYSRVDGICRLYFMPFGNLLCVWVFAIFC